MEGVFISAGGNELLLVDIEFDEKIHRVIPRLNNTVHWHEIASKQNWLEFQQQIGKIQSSSEQPSADGKFLLLMPGAIDAHVHFNTPGFEEREDFEHGSLAAAWGGVTTVIDMPCTSLPPVTNLENLNHKLQALKRRSLVDYALWGGVRGNDFKAGLDIQRQIVELAEAGVVGFKAYLTSGMDTFRDLTPDQIKQAALWIKATGKPLAVHAEDRNLVINRQKHLQAEGRTDWRAYCQSRDVEAEVQAVEMLRRIVRETGCAIHIVHLSSARGLELVRQAQKEGLAFSAETCPHYLHFTQNDFENPKISAYLKTAPPVKSMEDREALWEGLADGSLAFVTTDHAGCNPFKEKSSKIFWEVYGGIPGVEHRVTFLMSEGFRKGRLSLEQTIKQLASNAAEFFGLDNKGFIQEGKDADFTLLNLWEEQAVKADSMHSKGRFTPFEGVKLGAVVEQTWLRGEKIMDRTGKSEMEFTSEQWVK